MVLSGSETYTLSMRNLSFRTALVVSIGLWIITVASRFAYNGLVFGFDYGLFHPDGSLYAFKTLTLMGLSQQEAGFQVANWYAEHAFKLNSIDPVSLFFDNNPQWVIYGTRLAYPVMSIPFVAVLGMNGLLAVPALSYLILFIGILLLGHHYNRVNLALVIVFIFSISTTVGRWMLINSTDSLLVALTTILTYICVRKIDNRFWIPIALMIVVLGSLTRFSLFLWLGFAFVLLTKKEWARASVISLTAMICFAPTLFLDFQAAVLPNEAESSLFMKALKLPLSMTKMAFYDIAQLAVLDRILLLTLSVGILIAVKNFRSLSGRTFLATLFMLWCTAGLNGTPGVNFRYELPILSLLAWVIIENIQFRPNLKNADTQA
jgi:hypothetical protein